jgi:acyl-coenzyme A synthetase/AMP-(fatty) acid ligase
LELLKFARQSLADYKTPERILLFSELPKNANGKVDRPALKNLAATLLDGSELKDV